MHYEEITQEYLNTTVNVRFTLFEKIWVHIIMLCLRQKFTILISITDRSNAVVLVWSLLAVLVSEFRQCFTLCLFIIRILLVQFGLLSGHLFGNSCPLG